MIINPVFEKLSYDKKAKKFTQWPILLKDLLINLHNEIMMHTNTQDKEGTENTNIAKGSNQSKPHPKISIIKMEKQDEKKKQNSTKKSILCEEDLEESISFENDKDISMGEVVHEESQDQKESSNSSDDEDEEDKNIPKNCKIDYGIDMNCNEVLDELDRSESVTVRTIKSPDNEPKTLVTGEKVRL